MSPPFRRRFEVRWADLDANGHMANTAYLNAVVDVRFALFEERGLPRSEFRRLGIGPVVRSDRIEYFRELHLHDVCEIDFRAGGLAPDASRMRLVNEFVHLDGARLARVVSTGAWMDLATRRLVVPPPAMQEILLGLERTADFEELEPLRAPAAAAGGTP